MATNIIIISNTHTGKAQLALIRIWVVSIFSFYKYFYIKVLPEQILSCHQLFFFPLSLHNVSVNYQNSLILITVLFLFYIQHAFSWRI